MHFSVRHRFLQIFNIFNTLKILLGILAIVSAYKTKDNIKLVKVLLGLKLLEIICIPILHTLYTIDYSKTYYFIDWSFKSTTQIILQEVFIALSKFLLVVFEVYMIYSFMRRIERGEYVIAFHGMNFAMIMNQL